MLLRYYKFSIVFTLVCLGLGVWYGWAQSGSLAATASMLWIIFVLSILEVSLSFDNAVVNAAVLKDRDADCLPAGDRGGCCRAWADGCGQSFA